MAVCHGHLRFLCWVLKEGCPHTASMPYFAATKGHVKIVKYLLQAGYVKDDIILNTACEKAI